MTRTPLARHAPFDTPSAWGTLLRLAGISLAVALVSALGIGGFVAADVFGRFSDDSVTLEGAPELEPPSLGAYDGAFDLLLVGTDECGPITIEALGKRCEDELGTLNDVNILIHVSDAPRRVTVVSFPRDLIVPVPSCTREDGSEASAMSAAQLNSVFAHAGVSCIAKTVSDLADGEQIEFAAKISFDGVVQVTNDIGGVEVCIGEPGINDSQTGINWPAGRKTVSGLEALQFIRVRYGVGDNSDLGRISNQQQYMSRLVKKIMSEEVLTDVPTLMRLANTFVENVVPSDELANPVRLAQLALAIKDVPFEDFVFVQYPTGTENGGKTLVPNREAAAALWEALASNQALEITGGVSPVDGVEEVTPEGAAPDGGSASPAPDASATPSDRTTLPSEITGQTPNQDTCTSTIFN